MCYSNEVKGPHPELTGVRHVGNVVVLVCRWRCGWGVRQGAVDDGADGLHPFPLQEGAVVSLDDVD